MPPTAGYTTHTGSKALVGLVRTSPDGILEQVRRAMELAGWQRFITAGTDVSLKVNLGWDKLIPGAVSAPWVVEGVIQTIHEYVGHIYLVESDQVVVDVENALRYIVHTGMQWRYMAHDLLPWYTVCQQTQRWFNAGVFEDMVHDLRMLMREIDDRNPQPRAPILDSRTVQSTPESGGRAGYDGHKRRKGSKVHLAVDTLIQVLASRLHKMPNVAIRTQTPAARVQVESGRVSAVVLESSETIVCNHVISTVPLPLLLNMVPDPPAVYRARLAQVEYLGMVCGLFVLSQRLPDSFWVNIDDPAIPCNGIIECSNLNPDAAADGKTAVYVPLYVHTSLPCFGHPDAVVRADFVRGLQVINPRFDECWLEECYVSRNSYAQAICTVGFAELVPELESPLPGLLITDSSQFYPEYRTASAAIRVGRQAAGLISVG